MTGTGIRASTALLPGTSTDPRRTARLRTEAPRKDLAMTGHIIDSELFGNSFSTEQMREIFSARSVVQSWIDVEVALARAQGELGVIPHEAADGIAAAGEVDHFDLDALGSGIKATAHTLMPFLRRYEELCSPDHRGYLHWGATTQDIVDTASALRFRRGLGLLASDLLDISERMGELAVEHAETVQAGRTHGQHALPITFGYKAAVWRHEVDRHLERLQQLRPRVLVGNLTGAVGTMAFVGEVGPDVQRRAMDHLGLGTPEICWHSSRDRVAELSCWLAMTGATLGKVGREIYALQKTEFGELEEAFTPGKVGSSTMPQKRNPAICESITAKAMVLKAQAQLGFDVMMQEHERDKAMWQAEWEFLPEMFMLLGAITADTSHVLDHLVVNRDRMRLNLDLTNGLIMAESVMGVLAKSMGRDKAHELVYEISMACAESNTDFAHALRTHPDVAASASDQELIAALDPLSYTGVAAHLARAAGTQ